MSLKHTNLIYLPIWARVDQSSETPTLFETHTSYSFQDELNVTIFLIHAYECQKNIIQQKRLIAY